MAHKTSKQTVFAKWTRGEIGYTNLGSFQTKIFDAYWIADTDNEKRPGKAFPEWLTREMPLRGIGKPKAKTTEAKKKSSIPARKVKAKK